VPPLDQVVVYHNLDARLQPYRAGHRLTPVVSHWLDQPGGNPVAVADWAFRAFGNDPDLSAANPTASSDLALVARAYRLMGHRPVSVGDVVAVAMGSGRWQWLACDPTGWRPVVAPARISGVQLSDHPFGPSPDVAWQSGRRS
jgi:hypothetical protein